MKHSNKEEKELWNY